MAKEIDENSRERKKYVTICSLSFSIGIFFLILSGYMAIKQGVSLFEYEGAPSLPGNLRGLKFREFVWTICAGLAGVGNGWWYAKLYKDLTKSGTDHNKSQ